MSMRENIIKWTEEEHTEKSAFVDEYVRAFERLGHVDSLLEIGVHEGGSMRLWARLFTDARIYGIDESLGSPRIGPRTQLFSGKEQDVAFLDTVVAKTGPLDVVIDDNGHIEVNQTICFRKLFNHIRLGGFYAIEDLQHYNTQYQLIASSTHDQLIRIIGDTPVKDVWHTLDSAIGIIWK